MVLLLFAALLTPLFVDWTGFRQQFEDQASRIIGKKVVVYGSVDARLLPFPSITMNDVRVGQEPDGSPQVRVSRFSMDAELAPVLSGEAMIFDMRIEGLKARMRLLKDGTLDWMRGARPQIPARSIILENVRVTDGEITFIDEQTGRTRTVRSLNAAMSATSLAGPWRAVGDALLDGEAGRFSLATNLNEGKDAGIWLRTRIMPDKRPFGAELEGTLSLSADGKPSYKGNFVAFLQQSDEEIKAQSKTPAPRLKGRFELTNEKIRIPDYRLEVGETADPYVVTGEATLDTGKDPEFLLLADGQQIDVARIDYEGDAGKTGRDPGDTVRKRFERFAEIATSIPIPKVPGRASLKLPAILIGDTAIRDVRVEVRPTSNGWLVDNAVATLPGRTDLEAKGVLTIADRTGFDGHMLLASRQPSGLSTWLSGQVDPVIRDLKTLGFDADVRLSADLQRFDRLEMRLGDSLLRGKVERQSIEGAQPALSVQLAGNRIDLDALRGLSTLFGKDGKADLSGHAIAAELKAEDFLAFGMEAQQTEAVFTLSDRALSIERFNARDLAGAQVTAIGRAEIKPDGLDANGRIGFKADDPAPFLAMIAQKLPADPLLGHLLRHAEWFAGTELKATLAAGGKDRQDLSVKLAGVANGSRVDMNLNLANPRSYPEDAGLTLQANLENPQANILLGQAGLDPLPFDIDQKGVLSLRLTDTNDGKTDVGLSFNAGETDFDLKGRADLHRSEGIDGSFQTTLTTDDAGPYLAMGGITLPQIGLGLPGKLSAGLTLTPDKIAVTDLAGEFSANDFAGSLEFDRRVEGLRGRGTLSIAGLDLGWLAETVYGPVPDGNGLMSEAAFGPGMLQGMDMTLDLTAKTFWPGASPPVNDFKAKLSAEDGELLINDASGEWGGSRLAGTLRMGNTAGSGYLQANVKAEDGDLAAISWFRDDKPMLDGRFKLQFSAETAGKSMKELAAGLGGSGELRLSGTTVSGLNLGVLAPLTATMDVTGEEITAAKVDPVVETLLAQGATPIGDVTIPFSMAGGRLDVQPVAVSTPEAGMTGEGEADLTSGQLRASLTLAFNPGANAVEGADPTLRLDFSGPTNSPERTMDSIGLTNFLSLRAFERERHRVERLQAIALEKVRLRREAAFYKERADERERLRQEEEARRQAAAAEAERLRRQAEAEAAAKAEAEAIEQSKAIDKNGDGTSPATDGGVDSAPGTALPGPSMPVAPENQVIRGNDLPPPSSP